MRDYVGPQLNAEDKTTLQAFFPTKKFLVNVDPAAASANKLGLATDSVYSQIVLEVGQNFLTLDQLTILNIIASNGWKRPIYFTSPYGELGFAQYLRKEGLTYRFVPVESKLPKKDWIVDHYFRSPTKNINLETIPDLLLNKFTAGGADLNGIYFDEENRRHLLSIRQVFAETAGVLGDLDKKEQAAKILQKAESIIHPDNMPYAMASRYSSHNQVAMIYLEASFKAGYTQLADKLETAIRKDLTDQKNYYTYLQTERPEFYDEREAGTNNAMIELLDYIVKNYKKPSDVIIKENPKQDTLKRQ
jgi:hypothetical protein